MPVLSKIQAFLNELNRAPRPPMDQISPDVFRNMGAIGMGDSGNQEVVKHVENMSLPLQGREIPVRIYTPEGNGPFPVLVFYHGGGWVTGSLDSHDSICRALTNLAQCKVISVDYRLAPEHKFPAAVEDAYDSLNWIARHAEELNIDVNRIAVGGDSAGGNLATVSCIIAKERKSPQVMFQLLIYPSTGYIKEPPSIRENGEGYLLTTDLMTWFRKHYFNNENDVKKPYASPILYPDLSSLPPAFIATAQYDPLRDVGKEYAEKLKENGVEVEYKNYEGLIHGYANFHTFVKEAEEALEEAAERLRKVFS